MDRILIKRNHLLDVTRIVAVLAVVMTHCSAGFVSNYNQYTSEFIWGNILDSISRIGVPLFLMISGALFLDENKEVTLKGILLKNIKSIAFITIIWAIIYSLVSNVILPLLTGELVSIKKIIKGIVSGHFHMWYLYMIMGVYIITPFLKKFVYKDNKEMVLCFIIISFFARFFAPIINILCNLGFNLAFINTGVNRFNLGFFDGYLTYYLAGWYIVHIGIKQKWIVNSIFFGGAAALILMALLVHFTGDYGNAYENIGVLVFLYSVSVFLAINHMNIDATEKTAKKLSSISKLTFGVYIIHVLILTIYSKLFHYSQYCGLFIIVKFLIVVCSSFLISYLISKIPVVKKIIKA